jgi:8-oxo-dGTP pyrophosphatase MutT (NUDIX family)
MGEEALSDLAERLLAPADAMLMTTHGDKRSAVLIPISGWPGDPEIVFTERHADMRRHAGEISFPGGRPDPDDPSLIETALREASEEVSLDPGLVTIAGALPPTGTFVTGYAIYPFVGLIPRDNELRANPSEVEALLRFRVAELREVFEMQRLVRRGIPFRTPTYPMGEHLIWGATARILMELLSRLD